MADVQDVLNVLSSEIAAIAYPNGTGSPSITGAQINIFPGWPLPDQIDKDMLAGKADISIFQSPNGGRNVTRYTTQQHVQSIAAPTITLTVQGKKITVGGAMPSPFSAQNVAAVINDQAFIYPIQPGDTLTSIATGLSALIAASFPGTSNVGTVITVPLAATVSAGRVGTLGTVAAEWERQSEIFHITVWAPTPDMRATIGSAIKVALAQITFLMMPDGFGGYLLFKNHRLSDEVQRARVYRRDFFYEVEYATTVTSTAPTVVAFGVTAQSQQGAPIFSITH